MRGRGALRGRFSVSARADGVSQLRGQPGVEGQWREGGGSLACRFLRLRMCVLPHPGQAGDAPGSGEEAERLLERGPPG